MRQHQPDPLVCYRAKEESRAVGGPTRLSQNSLTGSMSETACEPLHWRNVYNVCASVAVRREYIVRTRRGPVRLPRSPATGQNGMYLAGGHQYFYQIPLK